jgi:hypothetical protein
MIKHQKQLQIFNQVKIALLGMVILIRLIILFSSNIDKFLLTYWDKFSGLEKVYLNSQYISTTPIYIIPDETAYSYVSGAYLKGASPIMIQPDVPPLGKYLIGLSIALFNNQNIVIGLTYLIFIAGCYTLAKLIGMSIFQSALVTLCISFEPLISDQIKYMPLMDIIMINLHIWAIIFCGAGIQKQKAKMFLFGIIFIGMAMMVKIFTISLPLYVIVNIFWIIKFPKQIKIPIIGVLLTLIIFCLTYGRIYWDGKTPIDVFRIQKWILWYHRSKINHLFTVWPLIFLNRWYVWWGDQTVITDKSWSLTWPFVFGGAIIYFFKNGINKILKFEATLQIIIVWVLGYSIMMSFGQATARYLLPILPYVYFLTILVLHSIYISIVGKSKI